MQLYTECMHAPTAQRMEFYIYIAYSYMASQLARSYSYANQLQLQVATYRYFTMGGTILIRAHYVQLAIYYSYIQLLYSYSCIQQAFELPCTVKTKVCITYFLGMFFLLAPCIPFFGMLCILLVMWYVIHTHKGMKYKLEIYFKLQEIHFKY